MKVYVYVMGPGIRAPERRSAIYKIGYTRRLVQRRGYAKMQYAALTGEADYYNLLTPMRSVTELVVFNCDGYQQAADLEARLHQEFSDKQVDARGIYEWFRLSLADLKRLKSMADRF